MKTLQKIQGLVATYKDSASSMNEQNSSYNLVSKLLQKEFNCDWITSFLVFDFLVEGSCYVTKSMRNQNPFACDNLQIILKHFNIKFKVETDNFCKNVVKV